MTKPPSALERARSRVPRPRLFGLAAPLIPGVGAIITAGVLASALGGATGGAIASGAIVGGTSGALAGAFRRPGIRATKPNSTDRGSSAEVCSWP